jgi:hypothetical protein
MFYPKRRFLIADIQIVNVPVFFCDVRDGNVEWVFLEGAVVRWICRSIMCRPYLIRGVSDSSVWVPARKRSLSVGFSVAQGCTGQSVIERDSSSSADNVTDGVTGWKYVHMFWSNCGNLKLRGYLLFVVQTGYFFLSAFCTLLVWERSFTEVKLKSERFLSVTLLGTPLPVMNFTCTEYFVDLLCLRMCIVFVWVLGTLIKMSLLQGRIKLVKAFCDVREDSNWNV